MKHFVLLFLLLGFAASLPMSFGQQMPHNFEMRTSDGELYYSSFMEIGKEIQFVKKVSNDATLTSIGNVAFYIGNEHSLPKEILKTSDFSIKSGQSEMFSTVYTPTKIGSLIVHMDVNYLIPQGSTESDSVGLVVVEKYSKAFAKNNGCADEFVAMSKPHFSSVICVSKETSHELMNRWNS